MRTRYEKAAWLLTAVLMAGCERKAPNGAKAPERVTNVHVEAVVPHPAEDRMEVSAKVEAWSNVRLSAEVSGRIEKVAKDEGDPVAVNETLFEIDSATLKAQLASAQAQQALAERSFARTKQLRTDNTVSQAEYDRADADLKVAQAAVDLARVMLDKATIHSPIKGVIDRRLTDRGEFVGPGTPLCDVVNTERVKVVAAVPEKDIPFVRTGDQMTVEFGSLGQTRTGTVIFQSRSADPRTLTFEVKLEVANADGLIRPGMIARVALVRRRVRDAITVPIFAVIRREGGYATFVENGGQAHECPVELGFFDGDRVMITAGLAAGDRLIVAGHRGLADGDKVMVVEAPGSASAPASTPASRPGRTPEP